MGREKENEIRSIVPGVYVEWCAGLLHWSRQCVLPIVEGIAGDIEGWWEHQSFSIREELCFQP